MSENREHRCKDEPKFITSIIPRSDGKYEGYLEIEGEVTSKAVFNSALEAQVYLLRRAQEHFSRFPRQTN